MPQANTAQREPSMEEILASIRRIIEDGDAPLRRSDKPGPDQPRPIDYAGDLDDEPEPEIEAFRDEFAPEVALAPVSAEPEVRLSDARLPTDDVEAISGPPEPIEAPSDGLHTADPALSPAMNGKHQPSPELSRAMTAAPKDDAQEFDRTEEDRRPSIISDRPGRQVAASFGELSEAFAASRRRSFDEMAEEMIRPMLQDWLDNNLPHLVERLVREEIERIARGGPR